MISYFVTSYNCNIHYFLLYLFKSSIRSCHDFIWRFILLVNLWIIKEMAKKIWGVNYIIVQIDGEL